MITIIHGSNNSKSREQLSSIRSKFQEVIVLNGKSVNLTDLIQSVESASLFGEKKLTIVENLLSQKTKGNNIYDYLLKTPVENLVFWEGKEIGKKDLSQLPKTSQIFAYNIPTQLFKFIELLAGRNLTEALVVYRELMGEVEPEVISHMLVRQWRFMILVNGESGENPSDFLKLQSWQKAKLTQTAKLYTLNQLVNFYRKLLLINYREKSGLANFSLSKQLEMLFLFELGK